MIQRQLLKAAVKKRCRARVAWCSAAHVSLVKSTLAQQFLSRNSSNDFDLECPAHAQRLSQAALTLEHWSGLVVIDEVQLKPDLFPLLRVLMDRSNAPGQ